MSKLFIVHFHNLDSLMPSVKCDCHEKEGNVDTRELYLVTGSMNHLSFKWTR